LGLLIAPFVYFDVETIVPDGQFIKVGQMREMAEKANFRPFNGRRRVYIMDDADRMNDNAANSILKVLEEPPDTTQLLLITAKPYALLETIQSRCQMLSFAPLSPAELEAYLTANYRRPQEETRLLARLAGGSIGRALEIDLGLYQEQRNAMLELIDAALISRDTLKLMQAAEQIAKGDRIEFETQMDALLVLLADLFRVKLNAPAEMLTNGDIAPRLLQLAEPIVLEQISDWTDRIETAMQGLVRNVNRRLAMESMLLAL
jgi:DNA polymerase-3 subunit delta'